MKKKNILFFICLSGILAFSSCEKNLYDESKQPKKDTEMTDLNIPTDFLWKTSKDAECAITSNSTAQVSLYQDEACKELLFTLNIDPTAPSIPLEIPDYVEKVYLQYQTTSGETKTEVAKVTDGKVAFTLSPDTKASTTRAKDDEEEDGKGDYNPQPGTGNTVLQYPSGDATVMFEDMYPSIGDYDFNDFVAWYKYQLQDIDHKGNEWTAEVMQIGFQIRAIGGVWDYSPYIRLMEVKYDDIEEFIVTDGKEIVSLKEGPSGEAILVYKNPKKPENSQYLNTEPEKLTSPGVRTFVNLIFKSPINLSKLQDKEIDIYLAKPNNGTEIHLKGYEPVYNSSEGVNYSNEKNYVWGLKAPVALKHTIEKTNFLKAYPKFQEWAEGKGGHENKQWWVSPKDEYLIELQ